MLTISHSAFTCRVLLILTLQVCCLGQATNPAAVVEASALVKAGKVKEAENLLRTASAADPNSVTLHGALGDLLFQEHKYEDCIQELNVAVGMDPTSRKNTILLAEALIGTQRFGVAVDFLNGARPRFGDYFQLHYDLGLAYYFMHKIDEALGEFQEAHRLSPKFDRAELLISACLIAKGDPSSAVVVLRKLVKERPDNAVYWGTLGRTLGQMGEENKAEAVRACRRALLLQPNDPHLQFDAGTVLTETGEFAAARPILERLVREHPEILAVHVQLAQVYSRLGLRELARKENEIVAKLPKQSVPENTFTPSNAQGGNSEGR